MIDMLTGALIFSYVVAGARFLRFWRRTGDRLFVHFAIAFWLFALDQLVASIPQVAAQTNGYGYLIRILGFALIICAIVDKNVAPARAPDERLLR